MRVLVEVIYRMGLYDWYVNDDDDDECDEMPRICQAICVHALP